jgi:hypothetical protein
VHPRYMAWLVGSSLAIACVALAFAANVMPRPMDWEDAAGVAVGLAVMGGSIAISLKLTSFARRRRDAHVARADEALRVVAARHSARYLAVDPYEHPAVGSIRYAGKVHGLASGRAWTATLTEGEDLGEQAFEIVVQGVPFRRTRLKSGDPALSAAARALVDELVLRKHSVEMVPLGTLRIVAGNRFTLGADATELEALVHRVLALAEHLTARPGFKASSAGPVSTQENQA